MRKKRILFCSEATFLNTGYATYTREIMKYLHSTGKYHLAELASYASPEDQRHHGIPWDFYPAAISPNDSEQIKKAYQSTPENQFGAFKFHEVCLDFKPDIVCDIRDFWMLEFESRSPYRDFFKWCIMPTVDASPQAQNWLSTFQSADACLTYSDWAGKILKEQTGNKINWIGSAPPSAHPAYSVSLKQSESREKMRLPQSAKIVGTVMRNQRRKLYPDLFKSFKLLLDKVDDPENYFLYCHTSYPDMGWDIPELLNEHNLADKVYFTYLCNHEKKPFAAKFAGTPSFSPFTNKNTGVFPSVQFGLSYEELAQVINCFDLYIQYANSEGFGLPQVEAAAVGVPVASVNYSAMETVIEKLDGIKLEPAGYYKELETGCERAVPDNELTANLMLEFLSKPSFERQKKGFCTKQKFLEFFQWDLSGSVWEKYFDSVDIVDEKLTWLSKPDLKPIPPRPKEEEIYSHFKNNEFEIAEWLITNVLQVSKYINSDMHYRLSKDLKYKLVTASTTSGGYYINDSSMHSLEGGGNKRIPFTFNNAFDFLANQRNYINSVENKRVEKFNLK
jgi:glycosyltransferase involved in cell wall biosynthesis